MIKIDVSQFMPQHEYNTRLKVNIYLNLFKVNKHFGKINPIHFGITPSRKFNFDLKKCNNNKMFVKYIINLNFDNILVMY